jgi:4-hydroxythreonine-4-phosphate dehydrogenase
VTAAAIAVSMGDPAGIGLEIAVKARATGTAPPFYLIADADAVERTARRLGADVRVWRIQSPDAAAACAPAQLPVLHLPLGAQERPGAPDGANAPAIIRAIERGVADAHDGAAAALVTLPISKKVLYEAGFRHAGHTEFVAELVAGEPHDGPRGPVMMLAAPGLRVSLATIHEALADVPARLTRERVERAARVTLHALRTDFGLARPRLALAGLNPHAGEGGALGREEIEIINPAAAALRAEGHDVSDARPPDTLFHAEARAGYDAVLAMYHDQGLIPIKTLDFWGATNITLGLPVVRVSPDHGAGFDIAGQNRANPASFIAAMRVAAEIAQRRRGA